MQANYQFTNVEAIRAVLRYRHRDCNDLLGYTPTYRYSAPRRCRVTDFLRAPSPPPDPTLPDVPLIRLPAEQEMAKRSRIKNLLTATSAEVPRVVTRSPAAGQSSGAVVALATQSAGQSSREAPARRAEKKSSGRPVRRASHRAYNRASNRRRRPSADLAPTLEAPGSSHPGDGFDQG